MAIDMNKDIDSEALATVRSSANSRLDHLKQYRPIQSPKFSAIATLHLHLPRNGRNPTTQSVTLYPLLDSLTGLRSVRVYFEVLLSEPVWTGHGRGRIAGWVMQLLGRVRPAVTLTVQVGMDDSQPPEWSVHHNYSQVVFRSWFAVVKESLAMDRREGKALTAAQQAGNVMALGNDAYSHEWCEAVLQRQQALLVSQGHLEYAKVFAGRGSLPGTAEYEGYLAAM